MIEVYVSSVIQANIDRVWAIMRDFNAMPAWHPLIAESRIEGGAPSNSIGCVRSFSLADGAKIREQLLALSDRDFSFTYAILEADIPLHDYVATASLQPVTDGDLTFGTWVAKFSCPAGLEEELKQTVSEGVFQAGFDALNSRFI